ncbi:MAG TPA: Ger(x)C family spore germination C-terminal domain-containing protein, partial [Bacillota bacterium]
DLAKEVGIERVVDFANRQFQIQRMSRLAVVQGRAKEVLSMDPPIGQSTSAYILNLISPSSGSSLIYISDLGKYNVYQADEGIEPVLPRVKKGKTSIETGGAAIIKDGKLAGWFTPFETRALDILQNEYKESNYVIASPLHPEDSIVVGLVDAGSVYRIKKEGRSFRVKIEITGSFETREFSGDYGPADLEGEDLQKRVAAKVRQEAESAIRRAQTVAADIFGIGRMIKARYPREWQKLDWTVEFSRLPIEVTVDMKWSQTVRRLGR